MSRTCNLTLDNIQGIADSVLRICPYYTCNNNVEVYSHRHKNKLRPSESFSNAKVCNSQKKSKKMARTNL